MEVQFHTENTDIKTSINSFISSWNDALPYFEVKTSGSTGSPKTIRIEKEHARASAMMTGHHLGLKSGQHALICLSPETIAGKMMLVRSLVFDLILHVVAPSSSPFRGVTTAIDFVAMVPMQLQKALIETPECFGKTQKIIVGGAPISPELEKKIHKIPATVYHSFGMTETISHIALRNVSQKKKEFDTLPGVSISADAGRLKITAPHLGVRDLETNDCVSIVNTREFVWHGRLDFVVISGGVKIHPEEVEKLMAPLIPHPFFVIGVHDKDLGEKLVLCIESNPYPIEKEIIAEVVPKYHVPKSVYFFQSFVLTKSEKINRLSTLASGDYDEAPLL